MGSQQSKQQPPSEELPKTNDGVPLALLDLSKVKYFQEWKVLVLAITNTNKDRQKQLQRIHECTLSCYLYLKSVGLKDDGSTTAKLIPEVTKTIQDLEDAPMPELKTLVTWQGLPVDWLIHEFFEHPYLLEVRKFGCEVWHFRKWGVIELIRQLSKSKDMGSFSGPFVEHLHTVRQMWESTTTDGASSERGGVVGLLSQSIQTKQPSGTPTIFISYTGSYTVEHLVEALGQLTPSELVWMDIFTVDQYAWTGKSRFPEMKKFKKIFVKDLQQQIGKIGHTALILQSWDDIMATLKKMWVLWEIFNTANVNAKLSVLLSSGQVKDFVSNCLWSSTKFDEIQKSLSKIDASLAEADDDGDRHAIFEEMSGAGFEQVNKRVSEVIRQWQIEIAEDALEKQQQTVQGPSWALLNQLGLLYNMQGSNDKALVLLDEAMKVATSLGKNHSHTLTTLNNRAIVIESQGKYEEARQLYNQVFFERWQLLGERDPDTLTSMNNLAGVLYKQGQYQEAKHLCQQVISLRKQVLGEHHCDTLTSMKILTCVLESQGQHQEAEQLHQHALLQTKQVLGEHHPDTLTSVANLAGVLYRLGQFQEAEQLYRQVWKQRQQVLGEHHPDTLASINNLADALVRKGQYQEAKQLYKQTLLQTQQVLGEHHPDTLTSMTNLAGVLYRQGQYQEAKQMYQQVFMLSKKL